LELCLRELLLIIVIFFGVRLFAAPICGELFSIPTKPQVKSGASLKFVKIGSAEKSGIDTFTSEISGYLFLISGEPKTGEMHLYRSRLGEAKEVFGGAEEGQEMEYLGTFREDASSGLPVEYHTQRQTDKDAVNPVEKVELIRVGNVKEGLAGQGEYRIIAYTRNETSSFELKLVRTSQTTKPQK